MEQDQELDVQDTLRRLIQAAALLESRLDEMESRVCAVSGLLQVQARDGKTLCEGFAQLSKIVEGHHVLLERLTLALPARKTPSTLQ
jgi:hypothetical protein